MRKNDLIKLLQDIKGNPEVVIWNGFVGDYQHIKKELFSCTLTKETLKGYSYYLNLEAVVRDGIEPYSEEECKKYYKNAKLQFELPNPYIEPEDKDFKRGFRTKKTVVMLEPKPRGVNTWDRLEDISY